MSQEPTAGVVGVGIDLVENSRMREAIQRWGNSLLRRLFTADEISYCEKQAAPWRHYAGRFAVKEAVAKALGTGIGRSIRWRDIEVKRTESGAPRIQLHGTAGSYAARHGITEILVSLSHSHHYALAQAVVIQRGTSRTEAMS